MRGGHKKTDRRDSPVGTPDCGKGANYSGFNTIS